MTPDKGFTKRIHTKYNTMLNVPCEKNIFRMGGTFLFIFHKSIILTYFIIKQTRSIPYTKIIIVTLNLHKNIFHSIKKTYESVFCFDITIIKTNKKTLIPSPRIKNGSNFSKLGRFGKMSHLIW